MLKLMGVMPAQCFLDCYKDRFLKALGSCLHVYKAPSSLVAYKIYVKHDMISQPNCISKFHVLQSLKPSYETPDLKTAMNS